MDNVNKLNIILLDIASCLGFIVYAASLVAIPVSLLNISNELGFDLEQGGMLELVRTLLLFVVLLIGGRITAYYGKPKMLSTGCLLTALGMFAFSFVHSYIMALYCIMLIGFGSGLLEALISPIVQDLHPNNSDKALNIVNAFFPLGILLSSLLIGYALTYKIAWQLIFQIIAVSSIFVGLLFLLGNSFKLPKTKADKNDISKIIKNPKFWLFGVTMLSAGAIEAAFTFWSASFIRLRFDNIASLGATATAIFAASMFVGRIITGYLAPYIRLRKIIKLSSVFGIIACLVIPFVNNIIGFEVFLGIAGLSTACLWPSILALSAYEMPVDSTLLMIFLSCFGILGSGLAGWLIGLIGNYTNLGIGLTIVPLFFIILLGALWFESLCKDKTHLSNINNIENKSRTNSLVNVDN